MSISRLATAVALVLAAAASLAVSPVGAQAGEGEVVSTVCQSGTLTQCGWEPAKESCAWDFSIGWNSTSILGITISFKTCTYVGEKKFYKDFIRGQSAGACVVHPSGTAPKDNTSSGGNDESFSEC
ncbi:hypothetical protein [Gemmatimonas sp. UBA7669]|uniref:hypothetical protein n=1 Tax=Gemmatimonas sp. UBA7669 TaxID=1946568 RepID=UPI0025C35CA9|nr:hypothetical protein [Gemmatimonas sp. UBA7669]